MNALLLGLAAVFGLGALALSGGAAAKDDDAPPGPPSPLTPIIPGGPPMPPPVPAGLVLTSFGVPATPPGAYDRPPAAQGPPQRFAAVRPGEGAYAFVSRVSGAKYAAQQPGGHWGWHGLESVNPQLTLDSSGSRYTDGTWYAGASIRIPDAWPGGVPSLLPGA